VMPITTRLELTSRGSEWVRQFDVTDRELAQRLLTGLTLVSHSVFDRSIDRLIRLRASEIPGPIALYATRETSNRGERFSLRGSESKRRSKTKRAIIDAVGRGPDVGSEARVASTIRSIAKSEPKKFLNHPTIEAMREARCRAIFVVDDIIGSGKRTRDFIDALWADRSLRSWWSLKRIRFVAIAYTGSNVGIRHVSRARCHPSYLVDRGCPTFHNLPWTTKLVRDIISLCDRYGRYTSKPNFALGYHRTMAALVFEHGAPNNVPAILWAPETGETRWKPLFPSRTVLPEEKSAFPPEVVRRDPISVLIDVGQARLAQARITKPSEVDETTLTVLAFAQKGVRTTEALSFATGLSQEACAAVLDKCVRWGLLTTTLRLTSTGVSELHGARRVGRLKPTVADKGDEDYYPRSLRRSV
jgi:hypothetical protein